MRLKSVKTLPWLSLFISLPNPTKIYPRREWIALGCAASGRQIGHLEFLKVKGLSILMIARSKFAAGLSDNGCIFTYSTFLFWTNFLFFPGIGLAGSSDPATIVILVLSKRMPSSWKQWAAVKRYDSLRIDPEQWSLSKYKIAIAHGCWNKIIKSLREHSHMTSDF